MSRNKTAPFQPWIHPFVAMVSGRSRDRGRENHREACRYRKIESIQKEREWETGEGDLVGPLCRTEIYLAPMLPSSHVELHTLGRSCVTCADMYAVLLHRALRDGVARCVGRRDQRAEAIKL